MVCKIISNKARRAAFTLIELIVATTVGLILTAATLSVWYYAMRSFAAITNYLELDRNDQLALDQITRDLRQATSVGAFPSATNISLVDVSGATLQYIFDP